MKKIFAIVVGLFLTQNLAKAHDTHSATHSLAAHNGLHYVEDLVDENRVSADFLSKLKAITVVPVLQDDDVIGFRAILEQVPGADTQSLKVEIQLDATARALTHRLVQGGTQATVFPIWPKDDAITLMEEALHYIVHNAANPAIAPFDRELVSISLSQEVLPDHTVTAVLDAKTRVAGKALRIVLNTDGTVRSAKVVDTL